MRGPFVALSVIALATCIFASSVLTVPMTKLQRSKEDLKGAPSANRARAASLKARKTSGNVTIPATNLAYAQYTVDVGIGHPAAHYQLIVDTGLSNTFCGTRKGWGYRQTKTSIPTGKTVTVFNGNRFFEGVEYLDHVTIARNFTIRNQSIGDATDSEYYDNVDGVFGVGPVDLTSGTLIGDSQEIPTIMNNLVSHKLIEKEIFGVFFAPAKNTSDKNGAISFGDTDSSLYQGELSYTPVTKTSPSSDYWGIDITKSTYGDTPIIPTTAAGIVDTGTAFVLLADNFFSSYINSIPGAGIDFDTTLMYVPLESVKEMKPLNFEIGGKVFTLDAEAQLIPEDENEAWGGVSGKRYGAILNMGLSGGQGFDFILGQKFVERYYAVFDASENRVGFAPTKYTFTNQG